MYIGFATSVMKTGTMLFALIGLLLPITAKGIPINKDGMEESIKQNLMTAMNSQNVDDDDYQHVMEQLPNLAEILQGIDFEKILSLFKDPSELDLSYPDSLTPESQNGVGNNEDISDYSDNDGLRDGIAEEIARLALYELLRQTDNSNQWEADDVSTQDDKSLPDGAKIKVLENKVGEKVNHGGEWPMFKYNKGKASVDDDNENKKQVKLAEMFPKLFKRDYYMPNLFKRGYYMPNLFKRGTPKKLKREDYFLHSLF